MTHDTKPAPRRAALPTAMLAALLLAGCSTGHIGESWQCPLAEGGLCDSVAAADPAVPDAAATGSAALPEPLWRVRAVEPDTAVKPRCASGCDGFDPFRWLARLLGEGDDGGKVRAAGPVPGSVSGAGAGAGGAEAGEPEPATVDTAPEAPVSPPAPPGTEPRDADPVPILLPAEADPARDGPAAGDLRTGEVVARIWIAPFVDADGVYREASHVRVVLEPAGWRLP